MTDASNVLILGLPWPRQREGTKIHTMFTGCCQGNNPAVFQTAVFVDPVLKTTLDSDSWELPMKTHQIAVEAYWK